MKLSLGPILFFWSRSDILSFYANMAKQPLDTLYIGETICSKRRSLSLADWLDLAQDLSQETDAEIVLSSMALIEAKSELATLKRLCANGKFTVEANDMAAVHFLSQQGLTFYGGSSLNIYNAHTLRELYQCGLRRWLPPVECSGALIAEIIGEIKEMGITNVETEVFAYGHLPLAYSARCFTARSENRPKDDCLTCCENYPNGIPLRSQEEDIIFTINGIQTLSGQVNNLIQDYSDIQEKSIDILRLSPQYEGMEAVIANYNAVRHGHPIETTSSLCNGYWHGQAGMLHSKDLNHVID